jgi:predicted DCC family thiol-disulfide oxidoreductase YuxK
MRDEGVAAGAAKWTLLYDGDCEFCRRQVRLLERWDAERSIEAVPLQEAELGRYGISRPAAEEAMHLIAPSGRMWRGAEAVREILRLLPRARALAPLFRLPGVTPLAERVYRWVAKRRHRFGCSSAVCRRGARDD